MFGAPVGAVFLGNATVDAYDESAIVALGSGKSLLVAFSEGGFNSAEVARIVAFGSNVCGAINNPPSNVQNFCPSSGKVRLHFGQLFIQKTSQEFNYEFVCYLVLPGSREFLFKPFITRVQFESSLVDTSRIIFLFGLHITITNPLEAKRTGQLFLFA